MHNFRDWIDGKECIQNPSLCFGERPGKFKQTQTYTKVPIKAYIKTYNMELTEDAIQRGQPHCGEGCCWEAIKKSDIKTKQSALTEVIIPQYASCDNNSNNSIRLGTFDGFTENGTSMTATFPVFVDKQKLIDSGNEITGTVTHYWRSKYVTNKSNSGLDVYYLDKNDALNSNKEYWGL
jgi:hypothetical protein